MKAAPAVNPQDAPSGAAVDDLPNPLEQKRRALRDEAVTDVVNGEATPEQRNGSTVVKVGSTPSNGRPAARRPASGRRPAARTSTSSWQREATDRIFVILAEFGDERHPSYPDQDTDPDIPGPATFDGPLHNAIPEPNRAVDNSTVWQPDYNRQHYQDLYFAENGRVGQDLLRDAVVGPLLGRRRGHRLGQGAATTRPGTAAATASRATSNVCSNTWDARP